MPAERHGAAAGRSVAPRVCVPAWGLRPPAAATPPPGGRGSRRPSASPALGGGAGGREPDGEARGVRATGSAGRPRSPRFSPELPAGRAAGGVRERHGRAARRAAGWVPALVASNGAVMSGRRIRGWGSTAWELSGDSSPRPGAADSRCGAERAQQRAKLFAASGGRRGKHPRALCGGSAGLRASRFGSAFVRNALAADFSSHKK